MELHDLPYASPQPLTRLHTACVVLLRLTASLLAFPGFILSAYFLITASRPVDEAMGRLTFALIFAGMGMLGIVLFQTATGIARYKPESIASAPRVLLGLTTLSMPILFFLFLYLVLSKGSFFSLAISTFGITACLSIMVTGAFVSRLAKPKAV